MTKDREVIVTNGGGSGFGSGMIIGIILVVLIILVAIWFFGFGGFGGQAQPTQVVPVPSA